MLPDDGRCLRRRDVVVWLPFRLVGDGVETRHHYLFSPRESEPSAHWGIMPEVTMYRQRDDPSAEVPRAFGAQSTSITWDGTAPQRSTRLQAAVA